MQLKKMGNSKQLMISFYDSESKRTRQVCFVNLDKYVDELPSEIRKKEDGRVTEVSIREAAAIALKNAKKAGTEEEIDEVIEEAKALLAAEKAEADKRSLQFVGSSAAYHINSAVEKLSADGAVVDEQAAKEIFEQMDNIKKALRKLGYTASQFKQK